MFTDELAKIDWDETTARIAAKTDNDVRRALCKEHCDVEDFMALISPAAEPYLETMAALSRKYTEERFGRTMSMFIPLHHQLLHQFLRILRIPRKQPDEKGNPYTGTVRG